MKPMLLFALAALVPGVAVAGSDSGSAPECKRFSFALGGTLLKFNTEARSDSTILGPGTTFSLESDLDVPDEETEFRFDFFYRFRQRHRLSLEIFYSERTGRKVLEETIQYEDTTFEIGLSVASHIEYGSARLAYQYSFLQGERIESSFFVGLSTVDFEGGLTVLGSIDDETGELVREEEEFLFPVPVFGLGLSYRPTPRVSLGGRIAYFRYKDSDEWDADILEFLAAAEYSVKPWFGLGLGYESVKMEYEDIDPDGFSIVYQYDGVLAYVRFAF